MVNNSGDENDNEVEKTSKQDGKPLSEEEASEQNIKDLRNHSSILGVVRRQFSQVGIETSNFLESLKDLILRFFELICVFFNSILTPGASRPSSGGRQPRQRIRRINAGARMDCIGMGG